MRVGNGEEFDCLKSVSNTVVRGIESGLPRLVVHFKKMKPWEVE